MSDFPDDRAVADLGVVGISLQKGLDASFRIAEARSV
ncbi:hypothetical protein DFR50_101268 [Roseiarcus fermentans]|uniref:Uncharacterized protein n=1 Tax=Roseiarcus fermentans TaxID=1473586 RepID=A0A366FUH0_9HYPH|nr:hypothetical protein DFR50_101268 [Roseiarcus fermentans]